MTLIGLVGDSLAIGLAPHIYGHGQVVHVNAKLGAPSAEIASLVMPADWLIISAGTNDALSPKVAENLDRIRARASAAVAWIVPHHPRAHQLVIDAAKKHNDPTVTFTAGTDGAHPKNYSDLARAIAGIIAAS